MEQYIERIKQLEQENSLLKEKLKTYTAHKQIRYSLRKISISWREIRNYLFYRYFVINRRLKCKKV